MIRCVFGGRRFLIICIKIIYHKDTTMGFVKKFKKPEVPCHSRASKLEYAASEAKAQKISARILRYYFQLSMK
jgi:hypothetical protein